jgi:FKBP-type peptidyl-prolyl cis-trans isomerase
VDSSPQNFQINYGTPDQLIRGLNYAICKLKIGRFSKIILPSHLAFGENGSSNGSIPPFTPMLYKISVSKKNK